MPEILSSIVMVSVPFSITTLSSSKEGGVSSSTAICSNLIRRLPEYHCLSGLHDKRLFLSGIQLAGTPESLSSSLKEEESGP